MPSSMADRLDAIQRKTVAARLPHGEAPRKNFASDEIAALVDAIVRHSKLNDKQFSSKLGHSDQSQLSRWRNGLECASALGKIWAVVDLQPAMVKAMAERSRHPDVKARLIVEVA